MIFTLHDTQYCVFGMKGGDCIHFVGRAQIYPAKGAIRVFGYVMHNSPVRFLSCYSPSNQPLLSIEVVPSEERAQSNSFHHLRTMPELYERVLKFTESYPEIDTFESIVILKSITYDGLDNLGQLMPNFDILKPLDKVGVGFNTIIPN